MVETDAAWLAGLFEGEGNFHIAKNGGTRATIRMCDLDIIERVYALFPGTTLQVVAREGVRTQYAWRISHPDKMRAFIAVILPWLGERRTAKALEVLAHLDARPGIGGPNKRKTHCAQGHEYTPENTIIRAGTDHRHCRICMDQWQRDYRNRKRSKASA